MSIEQNLTRIKNQLPQGVKLVAVSKFKPVADIQEAYNAGQRAFGENRVQELADKQPQLPADIEWHMIGHLQSNKIKYMASFVRLIHGVDSFKLLQEIDKQAQKAGRVLNCLLQIHIAQEETKFGFDRNEVFEMLNSDAFKALTHVQICGVMGMATLTDNENQVRAEFKGLKQLFDELKTRYFNHNQYFKEISMGMSGDYHIAVEEGSTIVRIGSSIFGGR
ncbi:MAG: YggS family pyridoxal phosphate-dependent enzyme [Bacteroidetes bacterium]|nr:MAG: YggS family pyridoxal phosphate-dependent enzyme [Bacteroidota bacterium]